MGCCESIYTNTDTPFILNRTILNKHLSNKEDMKKRILIKNTWKLITTGFPDNISKILNSSHTSESTKVFNYDPISITTYDHGVSKRVSDTLKTSHDPPILILPAPLNVSTETYKNDNMLYKLHRPPPLTISPLSLIRTIEYPTPTDNNKIDHYPTNYCLTSQVKKIKYAGTLDSPILSFNNTFYKKLNTDSPRPIKNIKVQVGILKNILLLITTSDKNKFKTILSEFREMIDNNLISEDIYNNINNALNNTIKEILGEKWNEEIGEAWDTMCYKVLYIIKNKNINFF